MKRVALLTWAIVALLALGLLAGCGGGDDDGGGEVVTGGTVRGSVISIDDNVGLGGVVIELRTQDATAALVASGTTDGDGNFTITNVPAGTYDVEVVIDEDLGFERATTDPIEVTVITNAQTTIPNILVTDDGVPDPPG